MIRELIFIYIDITTEFLYKRIKKHYPEYIPVFIDIRKEFDI